MRRPDLTLERIRPLAGPVLLGVFLLTAQWTPLVHLATHRNDHTHGPDATAGHDDDHDDDHDHEPPVAADVALRDDDHDHDQGEPAELEHHDDHRDPAAPPASNDHGRASSAHFGLALLEGPPPPFLPPPAVTLADPPAVILRWHHAPAQPLPPVRGPPRLS